MIAGIRYGWPMSERYVSVSGGRLFVVDDGADTDPPIVLLHAGIADVRSWEAPDELAASIVDFLAPLPPWS